MSHDTPTSSEENRDEPTSPRSERRERWRRLGDGALRTARFWARGLAMTAAARRAEGTLSASPRVIDRPQTLKVEEHRWVLHHFDVTASRGTVLLVHGYFDHALTWSDYIDHLTEQNWSVAALDLPGHGHSSGERAGIDDFATYHRALKAAIEALVDRSTPADAIVAHSTGAGVVMETLFTHEAAPLAPRIVLVAPLVRSAGWDVGRKAYQLGGHRMQGVPRVFTPSSADEDFTARLRSDPLQAGWVPSSFLGAVYAWHDRMANYPPSHADVLVLQGEDDRTLEWSYNLRFIADKLPRAHVYRIPRGRHHLVFDAEPMRSRVRVAIDDWIK